MHWHYFQPTVSRIISTRTDLQISASFIPILMLLFKTVLHALECYLMIARYIVVT